MQNKQKKYTFTRPLKQNFIKIMHPSGSTKPVRLKTNTNLHQEEYNKSIKIKNLCIKFVKKTIITLGCTVNKILQKECDTD